MLFWKIELFFKIEMQLYENELFVSLDFTTSGLAYGFQAREDQWADNCCIRIFFYIPMIKSNKTFKYFSERREKLERLLFRINF